MRLHYDWEKVRKIDQDDRGPEFMFNSGQFDPSSASSFLLSRTVPPKIPLLSLGPVFCILGQHQKQRPCNNQKTVSRCSAGGRCSPACGSATPSYPGSAAFSSVPQNSGKIIGDFG